MLYPIRMMLTCEILMTIVAHPFRYVADGNLTTGAALMDEFRAAAESVGQCLHLNHMTSSDAILKPRGVDSRADYGWVRKD